MTRDFRDDGLLRDGAGDCCFVLFLFEEFFGEKEEEEEVESEMKGKKKRRRRLPLLSVFF